MRYATKAENLEIEEKRTEKYRKVQLKNG